MRQEILLLAGILAFGSTGTVPADANEVEGFAILKDSQSLERYGHGGSYGHGGGYGYGGSYGHGGGWGYGGNGWYGSGYGGNWGGPGYGGNQGNSVINTGDFSQIASSLLGGGNILSQILGALASFAAAVTAGTAVLGGLSTFFPTVTVTRLADLPTIPNPVTNIFDFLQSPVVSGLIQALLSGDTSALLSNLVQLAAGLLMLLINPATA